MMLHWLIRASRWARHSPSPARVRLVVSVIVGCMLLYAIDRMLGWPDWLTTDRVGRMPH